MYKRNVLKELAWRVFLHYEVFIPEQVMMAKKLSRKMISTESLRTLAGTGSPGSLNP